MLTERLSYRRTTMNSAMFSVWPGVKISWLASAGTTPENQAQQPNAWPAPTPPYLRGVSGSRFPLGPRTQAGAELAIWVRCNCAGHEQLIEQQHLPDPDDRHVLAAALAADATLLVTATLRVPADKIPSFLQVVSPDEFVVALATEDLDAVVDVIESQAAALTNPRMTATTVWRRSVWSAPSPGSAPKSLDRQVENPVERLGCLGLHARQNVLVHVPGESGTRVVNALSGRSSTTSRSPTHPLRL